jgi:hypothetical protein
MSDVSARRIEVLEAAVAELREQLHALTQRDSRIRSMRQTHRCPACGGTKLLHFRSIKELGHMGLVDLVLQKEYSPWRGRLKTTAGAVEAFACRNCRLIEWGAISLDDIVLDDKEVVEIDGDAEQPPAEPGPYR